jgi:REP element-mobilizing transposase RayT
MPKHSHLSRLTTLSIRDPIYFVTTCTYQRGKTLKTETAHEICREVWARAQELYGWQVGRYVLMPDHAHFFCVPTPQGKPLPFFIGKWKEWTAKFLHQRAGEPMPIWETQFFDHVLRSGESYSEKWEYVRRNPVRAGLVSSPEQWPFQGCFHEFRVEEVERL